MPVWGGQLRGGSLSKHASSMEARSFRRCSSARVGRWVNWGERGGETSPEKKSSTELSGGFLLGLVDCGIAAVACGRTITT